MSETYMKRNTLKCAGCGGNEFTVEVNYFLPKAISLSCKCGYVTPIAIFGQSGEAYEINGSETNKLYSDAFCRDITDNEANKAVHDDIRAANL